MALAEVVKPTLQRGAAVRLEAISVRPEQQPDGKIHRVSGLWQRWYGQIAHLGCRESWYPVERLSSAAPPPDERLGPDYCQECWR